MQNKAQGLTLLEIVIATAVLGVIAAMASYSFQFFLDVFDQGSTDARLQIELRDASETLKKDLRDASLVFYLIAAPPAAPAAYLLTICQLSTGQYITYYVNATNHLVRANGISVTSGRVIAQNIDRSQTYLSCQDPVSNYCTDVVNFCLVASKDGETARLCSNVRPRNLP